LRFDLGLSKLGNLEGLSADPEKPTELTHDNTSNQRLDLFVVRYLAL
jgi:hypothetical protein